MKSDKLSEFINRFSAKHEKLMSWLIAILPLWVFLFYLYRQNISNLSFLHILVTILCFTVCALVLQVLLMKIFKSSLIGAIISNILWVYFFILRPVREFLGEYGLRNRHIVLVMVILLVFVIVLLKKKINYFQKKQVYSTIFIFWLLLFLFNIIPAAFSLAANIGLTGENDSEDNYSLTIDYDKQSPNVYWIFMDGMLGFDAFKYFFNDPQEEFVTYLTARKFSINYSAQFESLHSTNWCLPSMFSPNFYDLDMAPALTSIDYRQYIKKMELKNKTELSMRARKATRRNELIVSFAEKGYETYIITGASGEYFTPSPSVSHLYYLGNIRIDKNTIDMNDYEKFVKLFELEDLLYLSTPLGDDIPLAHDKFLPQYLMQVFHYIAKLLWNIDFTEKKETNQSQTNAIGFSDQLNEILQESMLPRLVIIHDVIAHHPFIYNENGFMFTGRNQHEQSDPYNYPPQHRLAEKHVIKYIDMILIDDPDAVIVLQADHGVHDHGVRNILLASGRTEEEVLFIQNSTISAVRIPEKWGGLRGGPLAPLNISRELVNRFVGENYRLLKPEEIIK